MQTISNLPLGKRARYYQSNMDLDCLEKGADYTALKKCLSLIHIFSRGSARHSSLVVSAGGCAIFAAVTGFRAAVISRSAVSSRSKSDR